MLSLSRLSSGHFGEVRQAKIGVLYEYLQVDCNSLAKMPLQVQRFMKTRFTGMSHRSS